MLVYIEVREKNWQVRTTITATQIQSEASRLQLPLSDLRQILLWYSVEADPHQNPGGRRFKYLPTLVQAMELAIISNEILLEPFPSRFTALFECFTWLTTSLLRSKKEWLKLEVGSRNVCSVLSLLPLPSVFWIEEKILWSAMELSRRF